MSDERVRELERRWKETGTLEDEVAYLGERTRSGDLPRARLVLAAQLDHPAARRLLGENCPALIQDVGVWILALIEDKEAHVLAGIAALELGRPLWEAENPGDDRYRNAMRALEAWAASPSPKALEAAIEAALQMERLSPISRKTNRIELSVRLLGQSLRAEGQRGRDLAGEAFGYLRVTFGSEALREAVQQTLLPWALG